MFSGRLGEQYTDSAQQAETAQLGMWVFIATEIMFFGALIFSYMIYRVAYPEQFLLAGHDTFILLGSINQALLITSSLTMVLAVRAAEADQTARARAAARRDGGPRVHLPRREGIRVRAGCRRPLRTRHRLRIQAGRAAADRDLLVLLLHRYRAARDPPEHRYRPRPDSHGARRTGAFSPEYDAPLEVIGLYWSFVDAVWFFLFACIYPLGRAGP